MNMHFLKDLKSVFRYLLFTVQCFLFKVYTHSYATLLSISSHDIAFNIFDFRTAEAGLK